MQEFTCYDNPGRCPGWVITPRIPGESVTSEPGGKAEGISSKSDIAVGMSEPGAIADVPRRWF